MFKTPVNYLTSLLSLACATCIAVFYLADPFQGSNNRLYKFLLDCSPDAFVALVAFPLLYWLFTRHGLHLPDTQESMADQQGNMPSIACEIEKASDPFVAGKSPSDLLIIVDVQNDFINGTLKAHKAKSALGPINNLVRIARANGMLVVFTRDWHPESHWSFEENGGPYRRHCVMNTPGAQISAEVYVPPDSIIVNFGVGDGDTGYSALENSTLASLAGNPQIVSVYVAGIALNYCVLATCVHLREIGKKTYAIEEAIASADGNLIADQKAWNQLESHGVIRLRNVTAVIELLNSFRSKGVNG